MSLVRTNVKAHNGLFTHGTTPTGYGPSDLQSAYDLPSSTAGSGATVAVVDAYDDPNAEADLQLYRQQYGLPVCDTANGCFEKVNQDGQQGDYPQEDTGWAYEESLDMEMVSAICPNCHILLVEANSAGNSDLFAAEDEAVTLGAKYVSNSWGECEFSGETASDQSFDHPGTVITASSGDSGYDNYLDGCSSPSYPAASPDVTAVGGTSLSQASGTTRGWSETVWSPDPSATGSGCSGYELKPTWQTDPGCANRMTNDVSADADPNTGVAVYDSLGGQYGSGWLVFGGTSVASPIIASTYALAGTPLAGTNPASYLYANAAGGGLNDVTSGTNYDASCTPAYFCTAGPGYDGPTGLGTPDGISAFTPVTYGTLTGTVANAATGKPVSGATVTVGPVSATTTSSGSYVLDLAPGHYSARVTAYGYAAQTATVQVTAGQTSTQNFALATARDVTLSGKVADGSGHKWPVYAKITVPGTPLPPVYTNPQTGQYTLRIPGQATYTLDVAPVYPGYTTATRMVKLGTAGATRNIAVTVDSSTCDAPGYALTSTQTCAPLPGGLVVGTVTDANTGQPVNGATVREKGHPKNRATSTATGDPAIRGGFYELFSPPGTHSFAATKTGYTDATATLGVTRNAVASWDWKLQAGHLVMTPATTSVTEPLGAARTARVSLANDGSQPVQVTLGAQDGGSTPTGGPRDGGLQPLVKGSQPRTPAAASSWTKIAKYPIPIEANAVATDPQTGDVYSIGGVAGYKYPYFVTDKGFVYNPAASTWSAIASVPAPLQGSYAAFVDGTLYLAGGWNSRTSGQSISPAVYAYSPALNTWSQVSSLPDPLYGGAEAVLDGQLYLIGGCDSADTAGIRLCTAGSQAAYRYDPQSGSWAKIASYPIAIQAEACAGIAGEVVCTGGASGVVNGTVGTSATYLYDPASNTWTQGADLPFPDYWMGYAGADGELQVVDGGEDQFIGKVSPAAQYDPATNSWSSLPHPLYAEVVQSGSCGVYEIGGGKAAGGVYGVPTRDAEVLPGYDSCDGAGALSWLSESQDSLTVAPGQSVTVSVRMNSAAVSQPGSYEAMLHASTNTPYPPQVTSVTMNVKPSQGMREVSGTVTAARGHALAAATVALTAAGQATAAVKTNGLGHFQWWLPAGSGNVQVSAAEDGYQPQAVTVAPAAGAPVTSNFTLESDPSPLPYTNAAADPATGRRGKTASASLSATDTALRVPAGPRTRPAQTPAVSGSGQAQDSVRHSLPADVKAVCGTPARGHAACMALVRTNVKSHKGLFTHNTAPPGYGPPELQSAYNLPSASAGSGETVAVVDAGGDPTAEADLGTYRAQYGLPPCTTANGCFEKVNQEGQQSNYPPVIGSWNVEESLDVDMISAICPDCHILLVEASATSVADLGASVDEAVTLGAKFVSNSYGTNGESSSETSWDQYYNHSGVAVTASAGDAGYGVHFPAASPYVTAVGGTTLTQDSSTPRGWTETAWDDTGSGCSAFEAKAAWQTDTGCSNRTDNDVAADADPSTGVAIYDTTPNPDCPAAGWCEVGGTSASSPIIAATYALAGTPDAGTNPASYPYVNSGGGLNDVTSGSNDSYCSPAYLCTAGPGYDGPTGLGTPDGTAAFTPTTYGNLSGTLTSKATGDPIAGATVTVGSLSTTTDASGRYSMDVASGSQHATATAYEYLSQTATVQVTGGQDATQNFTLAPAKTATVSGTVSDGSGHRWPLYAKIAISGDPDSPFYTNPDTGHYSITLPVHTTYTLTVTPVYPGYNTVTDTVKLDTRNVTRNVKVTVDTSTCDAPGYSFPFEQDFNTVGAAPPAGWSVTDNLGQGYQWTFNDPTGRGNLTGGQGNFAIADALLPPSGSEDTVLTSPVFSLPHVTNPVLSFATAYGDNAPGASSNYAEVDLSTDGGKTWASIWQSTARISGPDTVSVPIPQAAGQRRLQIRFHYASTDQGFWEVDSVAIGTCRKLPGGLVTGVVKDANTGNPVSGATVTEAGNHGGSGTSAAAGAPAIPGGFYWLFSPAGQQNLTATDPGSGYATAISPVDVTRNAVTQQNWALQAGQLTVTPASSSVTETLGQDKSVKLTYTNNGSAPLQLNLGAQDAGYIPATGTSASARPDAAPAGSAWSSIAPYPIPVSDNAVATDAQTGDVYSIGGYNNNSFENIAASYVYQPSTGQWSPIASLPQALQGAAAAFIDGALYVAGGEAESPNGNENPVATIYAYNPGANSWTQLASLPQPLGNSGVAVLDGQLYVIGGCAQAPGCGGTVGSPSTGVYRYNPAADTWTTLRHYPLPIGAEACAGIDGQIACTGGETTVSTPTRDTWLYNPRANHWTQGTDLPYPDQEMAYTGANGKLQIAGGVSGEVNNNTSTYTRVSQYDPATGTWASLPPLSEPISDAGSACGMYVIGGQDPNTYDPGLQAAEQLPGYDECDGSGDTGWVKPSQAILTLAPGASATVTVRLDSAKVTQPGTYQAMIYAAASAPYPVQVATVSMVVQPPSGWIQMSGKVTSSSGTPISGATVQIDTSASSVKTGPVDYTVQTGTNGHYQWWLDPGADDPLQVIAAKGGYIQQVVTVAKPKTTLEFALSPFPSVPY